MSNIIKFSHRYDKLPDKVECYTTWLVWVETIDSKDISTYFKYHDTLYLDDLGQQSYPLPEGKCLLLIFVTHSSKFFPTIRRWTPRKEAYYKSNINQNFQVVFT